MSISIDWGAIYGDADSRRAGRKLVRAFIRDAEEDWGSLAIFGAKKAVAVTNSWLGGMYADEAEDLAGLFDCERGDILLANLAYDFHAAAGCSTFAVATPNGPLHCRNLDWDFPGKLLRENAQVIGCPSDYGDYLSVTWPGVFGVLTACAPKRFSVSVNWVGGDGISLAFLRRAACGYMPVTWALRQVCEEARDFSAAVRMLKKIPLLAPVLFTVVGVKNGERVVIERGTDDAFVRHPDDEGRLVVTNHCANDELDEDDDTAQRFAYLESRLGRRSPSDANDALKLLSSDQLLCDGQGAHKTQYQVAMLPRSGEMTLKVPGRGGRKEVY